MPKHTHTQPEEWRPVAGYEGSYEVSDHGNVRSIDRMIINKIGYKQRYRGKLLAPRATAEGYLRVGLPHADKRIHRLVLEAFVGPCPEGMEACHNDGNPANNHLGNLRWDTPSANNYDQVRHGTHHQVVKVYCSRGHELEEPNLVPSNLKRGYRNCLACSRARAYVVRRAELRPNLQQISDRYYAAITNQKEAA